MLSATLDNPYSFVKIIENMAKDPIPVILSEHKQRIVPLEHHTLLFFNDSFLRGIKDPILKNSLQKTMLFTLKTAEQPFETETYLKMSKLISKLNLNKNESFVINETVLFLKDKEQLPAIFFTLSRKNVMTDASSVTLKLLEVLDGNPILDNEVRNFCNFIMRKIPNYHEYTNLP